MKKVLIVIPSLEQGGGQKFVLDLAEQLNKDLFQIKLLVYYGATESIFDKVVLDNKYDVKYLDKKKGLDWSFFKKVKKFTDEYKPDIIHTNLHSMLYLFPSYKSRQIKIHTVHTMAEKESIGLQRIVRFIAYKIFKVIPVAICDAVAESISREHRIKLLDIPVVYNGVCCNRYDVLHKPSNMVRLVTVGTIYEVKNHSFLVDCFAELCKEFDNIRLTIVGDGILRGNLESQIKELKIEEKVVITGTVSDVENYLMDADIYVAASLFEGLPLSMLEAMAAGLPIVSTDVGGVRDIIKNKENGILVPLNNKNDYIDALRDIICDSQMRVEYSKNAKLLSKKFDEAITVAGYERLYQGDTKNYSSV